MGKFRYGNYSDMDFTSVPNIEGNTTSFQGQDQGQDFGIGFKGNLVDPSKPTSGFSQLPQANRFSMEKHDFPTSPLAVSGVYRYGS